MVHQYLPLLFDVVAQGLAVALIAFASQSAQMTHRDSPIAVIVFAAASILLFTLPRVGGDSRLPHIVVLIFGLTTLLAYLLDVIREDCSFDSLIGKPPNFPSDPLLCHKAAITWWLDLALFLWIKLVLIKNVRDARNQRPVQLLVEEEGAESEEEDPRPPLLRDD